MSTLNWKLYVNIQLLDLKNYSNNRFKLTIAVSVQTNRMLRLFKLNYDTRLSIKYCFSKSYRRHIFGEISNMNWKPILNTRFRFIRDEIDKQHKTNSSEEYSEYSNHHVNLPMIERESKNLQICYC